MDIYKKLEDDIVNVGNKIAMGDITSLDGYLEIKKIEDECKRISELAKDSIKENFDSFVNDIDNYGGEYKGYKFTVVNGSKKFDYKHINEWKTAKENLTSIENKYKTLFDAKQKGLSGAEVDIDTGEILELPKVNYSSGHIRIKKQK